ncbi:MAG: hypothetical protein HQL31_05245 [Planctomycetes bacterium]|nr:hypothetical protein [Planctomycetota bacterium]
MDQVVAISGDEQARLLAQKYDISSLDVEIPGNYDRPFTFEDTAALVRNVIQANAIRLENILIADHRNLLLSTEDMEHGIALHRQDQGSTVITLAPCRDHPCQYQAFFNFIGCEIIPFQTDGNKMTGAGELDLARRVEFGRAGFGEITVCVQGNETSPLIGFQLQTPPAHGVVAQILPFTADGPLYDKNRELFIQGNAYEMQLDTRGRDDLAGVIVTLLEPKQSGAYDTVEHFTPPSACWNLGGPGSVIVDKESYTPLQGRQQFAPAYWYDGSICIMNADQLVDAKSKDVLPLIIRESSIVTDWIDYYGVKN